MYTYITHRRIVTDFPSMAERPLQAALIIKSGYAHRCSPQFPALAGVAEKESEGPRQRLDERYHQRFSHFWGIFGHDIQSDTGGTLYGRRPGPGQTQAQMRTTFNYALWRKHVACDVRSP